MSNTIDPAVINLYPANGQFKISVRAADADGKQACYFVSPKEAKESKYLTQLAIRNISGGPITIDKSGSAPHFTLRFRPGMVNEQMVQEMLPLVPALASQLGDGWIQNPLETDDATGLISVGFRYNGTDATFEWPQGETLSFSLGPVPSPPLSGAFFVKLELDYGVLFAGEAPLVINLAAVDLSGQTYFPMTATVRGSNTILNDGESANGIATILMWANQIHASFPFLPAGSDHESGSSIILAIPCAETAADLDLHPDVMGRKELVQAINPSVRGVWANPVSGTEVEWDVVSNADTPGWMSWVLTPKKQLSLDYDYPSLGSKTILSQLEISLEDIISDAPDGTVNVYLNFHHMPGYADHTIVVPFEKGPLVIRGEKLGVGVAEPDQKITLSPGSAIRFVDPAPSPGHPEHGTRVGNHPTTGNGFVQAQGKNLSLVAGWESSVIVEGGSSVGIKTGGKYPKTRLEILDGDTDTTASVTVGTSTDNASLKVNGNAEITKTITAGAGANATAGDVLLKLNSQRSWQFEQSGTEATTGLVLKSAADGKGFTIKCKKGRVIISGDDAGYTDTKLEVNGKIDAYTINLASGNISTDDDLTLTSGRIKDKSGFVTPVGSVMAYAGASAPAGWLLCDGKDIPGDSKYDDLKSIVGNKTPNLTGRFVMGVNPDGYEAAGYKDTTFGKTGGAATHKLTEAEMPRHSHWFESQGTGNEKHSIITHGKRERGTTTTSHAGSDEAHNNLPPFLVLNYIIKY